MMTSLLMTSRSLREIRGRSARLTYLASISTVIPLLAALPRPLASTSTPMQPVCLVASLLAHLYPPM